MLAVLFLAPGGAFGQGGRAGNQMPAGSLQADKPLLLAQQKKQQPSSRQKEKQVKTKTKGKKQSKPVKKTRIPARQSPFTKQPMRGGPLGPGVR